MDRLHVEIVPKINSPAGPRAYLLNRKVRAFKAFGLDNHGRAMSWSFWAHVGEDAYHEHM